MSKFKSQLNQRGATYLILMFSIVLLGITMGMASRQWKNIAQREMEEEIIFRGDEIRDAIEAYYLTGHAGMNMYPKSLEDLTKDPSSANKRYLRRPYKDPITRGEWEIIKDPKGGIKGVRSKSDLEPFKKANFPDEYKGFEGKSKYSDWVFEYNPRPVQPSTQPGQSQSK